MLCAMLHLYWSRCRIPAFSAALQEAVQQMDVLCADTLPLVSSCLVCSVTVRSGSQCTILQQHWCALCASFGHDTLQNPSISCRT